MVRERKDQGSSAKKIRALSLVHVPGDADLGGHIFHLPQMAGPAQLLDGLFQKLFIGVITSRKADSTHIKTSPHLLAKISCIKLFKLACYSSLARRRS